MRPPCLHIIPVSFSRRILHWSPFLGRRANLCRRRSARCSWPLLLGGKIRDSITKPNLFVLFWGPVCFRPRPFLRGSLPCCLFGGFDSGAFLFLGDATERQLQPLKRRALICELSATWLLLSKRKPPRLASRIGARCACPASIYRIPRLTRNMNITLPVDSWNLAVFRIHCGRAYRPVWPAPSRPRRPSSYRIGIRRTTGPIRMLIAHRGSFRNFWGGWWGSGVGVGVVVVVVVLLIPAPSASAILCELGRILVCAVWK